MNGGVIERIGEISGRDGQADPREISIFTENGLPPVQVEQLDDISRLSQDELETEIKILADEVTRLDKNLDSVIVGMKEERRFMIISALVGRHMLLEGAPGHAKTLLCRCFAQSLGLTFQRIQFTPDLTANDIIGFQRPSADKSTFEFQQGPIFANVVLADEINRAPGKTQSALLEAMQEGQVSVDRTTYALPRPFIVLATQNPMEISQATYALPDAQLDRFGVKMGITYPSREELIEIQVRDTKGEVPRVETLYTQNEAEQLFRKGRSLARGVLIEPEIHASVAELIMALNPAKKSEFQIEEAKDGTIIRGPSPRAAGTLLRYAQGIALLDGRSYVRREDVHQVVSPVLRHRVELSPEKYGEEINLDHIIRRTAERCIGR